jgi:hypothetical protein
MPEELAPETPETPETPEPAAPESEGTPAAPEEGAPQDTNWEKRFNDLQPELTKAQQENAELRRFRESLQDPETQKQLFRELAEELEYELEEEELDDEEIEELRDPRVDALIQEREAEKYEDYLDDLDDWVGGEVEKLAKAAGVELSDEETDLVYSALVPSENGDPDVERAFKKVTGLRDSAIKSYVAGKHKAPQAPSGASPSSQPDLGNDEARREHIFQKLANR